MCAVNPFRVNDYFDGSIPGLSLRSNPGLKLANAFGVVHSSPALFIPFAEHTGYIKVLTQWVLAEAIRQCGEWCRAGLRLQISVNISASRSC